MDLGISTYVRNTVSIYSDSSQWMLDPMEFAKNLFLNGGILIYCYSYNTKSTLVPPVTPVMSLDLNIDTPD